MEKVKLTIDGKAMSVNKGTTVFQAAKAAGISIPHLCYREDLGATGACRICLVEVEGARTLVASCSFPVSEGMVVKTDTPRVINARKMVLELILSDHPFDCMTCEKSGSCKLEKYAYQMGLKSSRFEGERHHYSLETSNPFIGRDYNKCILCGRCVTACNEVQQWGAIDYSGRGFATKVGTAFDRGLVGSPCVFCGQCVEVCPVGALTEKKALGMGRTWEMKKVRTTCPYCGVGCQLWLHVRDSRIAKVTAVEDAAPNDGRLCVKGRFGYDFIYSEDRLKTPLIRDNGSFREASWDEALNLIATKFKEIIADYGADAIGGVSCSRSINEDSYQMQKLFRSVIGTNNIDNCART